MTVPLSAVRTLFAGVVLSIAACTRLDADGTATVRVGGGVSVVLPRSPDAGRTLSAVQLVVLRHGTRTYALNARLRGDPAEFYMVAMDGLGRRAFAITWRATELDIQRASWLPESLPTENILADMFLIFWPPETVRTAIRVADGTVEIDDSYRAIAAGGSEVLRIDYPTGQASALSGTVRYRNAALGYTANITSTGIAP